MKTVTINLPGTRDWKELQIAPGTTSRDVLRQLGLSEAYQLTRWNSVNVFGVDENMYQLVEDGEKLQAVSNSEVAKAQRISR